MVPNCMSIRRLAEDDCGTIAITFGLTSVALLMAVGLATDMGIALHARTRLAQAVDSAALSAAQSARLHNLSMARTEAVARDYVDAIVKDMSDVISTHQPPEITVSFQSSRVEIKLKAVYRTQFGGLVGLLQIPVSAEGTARIGGEDIEVALGLDVTGSMAESAGAGGGSKLDALKSAATLAVTTLMPEEPGSQSIRIALAPYHRGVNAGSFGPAVNGSFTDECTYERLDPSLQATDLAPIGPNRLAGRADLPSEGNCPTNGSAIVPLTDSVSTLTSAISGLTAESSTAGHLGIAWSWYLLSPEWNSVWPESSRAASYSERTTIKVAIQMTDGGFNTVAGTQTGTAVSAQSYDYARRTCTAMKQKNITVYTVAFGDDIPSEGLATLQSCATDSSKFYAALDQEGLEAAYKAIASDIKALRLTK